MLDKTALQESIVNKMEFARIQRFQHSADSWSDGFYCGQIVILEHWVMQEIEKLSAPQVKPTG